MRATRPDCANKNRFNQASKDETKNYDEFEENEEREDSSVVNGIKEVVWLEEEIKDKEE